MAESLRRVLRRGSTETRKPILSFGSWESFPVGRMVQVCHPDWRGVRAAAYAFGGPVVECDELDRWGSELVNRIDKAGVSVVVIQGWPPGSAAFVERLSSAGVVVKCVLHSSPAQHGAEPGEAEVVDEILGMLTRGVLAGVGMGKSGVHGAFASAGYEVSYVPNRTPKPPETEKRDLGPGTHVGVFAEPFWRKNVATQLLSVPLIADATAHVLRRPAVGYLKSLAVVEHGELPWREFVGLLGSVDLNLYVTLSECHPLTPIESYMAGVPCLVSRTSSVFRSDPVLWQLTTTDEPDNPDAIASAARRLMTHREEAVTRAREWMDLADAEAAAAWADFVDS